MIENLSEDTAHSDQPQPWLISLRTRLILSYILVTVIAIVALGYYIYLRALQSNVLVSTQLDASVLQQAEANLTLANAEQANNLNGFFTSISNDMTTAGTTASELLSYGGSPNNPSNWDASKSLVRAANGSWTNSSSEKASVFIPSRQDLTDPLISELNSLRQLDVVAPAILNENPDASAIYFGGLSGETLNYPNNNLASVVPPYFDVTQQPWFQNVTPSQDPGRKSEWSTPNLDITKQGLIVTNSLPIYDSTGNFRGVIAMDIQLTKLTDIVSNIHIGQTGYAILIDKDFRLIAISERGYNDLGIKITVTFFGSDSSTFQSIQSTSGRIL